MPVWKRHIPKALFDHLEYGKPLPEQSLEDYVNSNNELYKSLQLIPKDQFLVYKVGSIFCKEYCQITNSSGNPYYFDVHHLTITGSELLRPLFYRIITDTTIK